MNKPLQIAAAVLVGVTYWIILLALPDEGSEWEAWVRWVFNWGGLVVLVVGGIAGILWLISKWGWAGALSLICLFVGAVAMIVGQITINRLNLDDPTRFAIGVGGLALAGLIFGLIRFDTIRAAVSIPAAVLVIGVTTWPDAEAIVGSDVRTSIIQWMGILLGANGVAEAVTQAAQGSKGDTVIPPAEPDTKVARGENAMPLPAPQPAAGQR